jgi:hypothetical protein
MSEMSNVALSELGQDGEPALYHRCIASSPKSILIWLYTDTVSLPDPLPIPLISPSLST